MSLAIFLSINVAVALFASRFKPGAWYDGLVKPSWTPPRIAFPIIWTALYALMAVAAWIVWQTNPRFPTTPLVLYGIQLILNALWSWIFFGRHKPSAALIDIIALWIFIILTTSAFTSVRPLAGVLLIPYIIWVAIAAALNAAVIRLNPEIR